MGNEGGGGCLEVAELARDSDGVDEAPQPQRLRVGAAALDGGVGHAAQHYGRREHLVDAGAAAGIDDKQHAQHRRQVRRVVRGQRRVHPPRHLRRRREGRRGRATRFFVTNLCG